MENFFITITGINYYLGKTPFKPNRIVKLVKDTENDFDSEAIKVSQPFIGTVGYVANSIETVCDGTCSAGRIYDKIEDTAYAKVMFITNSFVIAELLSETEVEEMLNDMSPVDRKLAENA